jgi:hypothetical protein
MSTPSGKPFYPTHVSYAPKKVRERYAQGHPDDEPAEPEETDGTSDRPSYSERPSYEADHPRDRPVEGQPFEDDDEHHCTPLVPADEPDQNDDGDSPPSAYEHRDADRDSAEDAHEGDRDGTHAHDSTQESTHEEQLEHLEATLKWLRRESAAPVQKLPRASRLPPVPGLRSPDQLERETYVDGFRVPRSLKPSLVPPPPMREEPANHLGAVLRITIACVIAAPIAFYFAVGNPFALSQAVKGPRLASADAQADTRYVTTVKVDQSRVETEMQALQAQQPLPLPLPQQPQVQPLQPLPARPATPVVQAPPPWPIAAAEGGEPGQSRRTETNGALRDVASFAPASPPRLANPAASPRVANAVPVEPAQANPVQANPAPVSPVPVTPARTIDQDEIALLLKQGERFIAAGDLVTARLVLRRAAEAGNADGALALGMTYDPAMLEKIGVRGLVADIDQARAWYEKARELGSAEAAHRLELLASR